MNQQGGFPWHPSRARRRTYKEYSLRQEAQWQAIDAVNTALTYGRGGMLRPGPYFSASSMPYEAWRAKVIQAWRDESRQRDPVTSSPGKSDIPEHLWLWWYEAMLKGKGFDQSGSLRVE